MPEIKIQHVVSVSSEDKSFPAENLVKGDSFKKWKCLAGEKQAAVVFQFEKATEVRQIDIGNEGSAFVEVLVGKSSSLDCDYEVILASSSFMNPMESRSSQNPNRVRIFNSDQLSRAVLDQKWDRVKVICTQPFNKTVQYGLSFIKFHSSPASKSVTEDVASKNKQETTTETQIGGFKLKSDPEPSSTLIRAGSLFEKSKTNPDQPIIPISGAAAIRAASKQAEQAAVSSASKDIPATSKEPVTSKEQPGGGKKESRTDGKKSFTEKSSNNVPPAKKPKADETTSEQPTASTSKVPFNQLMKGVVFALSGFQNPERGNLRDKATEMGAVYKPDWGKGCTHLICAFTNTPKYDQVAGRGYIVKKSWITDCHAQKKLLPWRDYRLGKAPSPAASGSDTDADDDPPKKKKSNVAETKTAATSKGQNSKKEANENSNTAPGKAGGDKHKEPEQPSAESQDTVKMESDEEWNPFEENKEAESECDTEEEVRRFEEKQARTGKTSETSKSKPSTSAKPSTSKSKGADNYDVSTDEETNSAGGKKSGSGAKSDDLPELPSFFSGKTFLLYGKLNDRRATVRYITAYDGQLADYMGDSVKYVITDSNWDETFDEALKENPDLIFVRSTWIQACHSAQAFLPPIKYSVAAP